MQYFALLVTFLFCMPAKFSLLLVLGCFLWLFRVEAQTPTTDSTASTPLYTGYGIDFSYNLYSRNRLPSQVGMPIRHSGQALNLLPGVGLSWWLGDVDRWTVSVSAAWEWLPFQLSLRESVGLGAWRLPLMARVQVPLWKQQSLWLRLSAGAGAQYQRLPWYDVPEGQVVPPAYWSGVGELGLHVTAVGTQRQRLREVLLFVRWGIAARDAQSIHVGLRLSFWNKVGRI